MLLKEYLCHSLAVRGTVPRGLGRQHGVLRQVHAHDVGERIRDEAGERLPVLHCVQAELASSYPSVEVQRTHAILHRVCNLHPIPVHRRPDLVDEQAAEDGLPLRDGAFLLGERRPRVGRVGHRDIL